MLEETRQHIHDVAVDHIKQRIGKAAQVRPPHFGLYTRIKMRVARNKAVDAFEFVKEGMPMPMCGCPYH